MAGKAASESDSTCRKPRWVLGSSTALKTPKLPTDFADEDEKFVRRTRGLIRALAACQVRVAVGVLSSSEGKDRCMRTGGSGECKWRVPRSLKINVRVRVTRQHSVD